LDHLLSLLHLNSLMPPPAPPVKAFPSEFYVTGTSRGIELSPYEPAFEEEMTAARKVMRRYRNALRQLAERGWSVSRSLPTGSDAASLLCPDPSLPA
jgi:hypothetical protein